MFEALWREKITGKSVDRMAKQLESLSNKVLGSPVPEHQKLVEDSRFSGLRLQVRIVALRANTNLFIIVLLPHPPFS